jgi:hypothetical protein
VIQPMDQVNPAGWNILLEAFSVSAIMTPRAEWNYVEIPSNLPQAEALAGLDFAGLPHPFMPALCNGQIIGLIRRDQQRLDPFSYDWVITHDTPIPIAVYGFIQTGLPAYFVIQNREIIGLVTQSDVNRLSVRIFVYHRISELELSLARFIRRHGGPWQREEFLSYLSGRRRAQIETILAELDREQAEIDYRELLYLSDLITVVEKDELLRGKLGLISRKNAEALFSGLTELRNQSMHPMRPLVKVMPDDLNQLWDRLSRTTDIINRLRSAND